MSLVPTPCTCNSVFSASGSGCRVHGELGARGVERRERSAANAARAETAAKLQRILNTRMKKTKDGDGSPLLVDTINEQLQDLISDLRGDRCEEASTE